MTNRELSTVGLAQMIKDEFQLFEAAATSSISHAYAIGELLTKARAQVGWGGWAAWVETNCPFSARMASTYLKVYKHREEIEANRNCISDFSLSGSLKLIGRKPSAPGPQGKLASQTSAIEIIPPGGDVDYEGSPGANAPITVTTIEAESSDGMLEPEVIPVSTPSEPMAQESDASAIDKVVAVRGFGREATILLERLEIFIESQAGSSLPRLIRDLERMLELARRRCADTSAGGGA